MELVRDNIINKVFRAIAMVFAMVFALVLGSCGEPTTTGVLPSPMSGKGLPAEFSAGADVFKPAHQVNFQNGFDGAGMPMVILQFSPEDGVTLGEFTQRHVGEAVELRVCGDVLSAPVVQEAITGGKLVLSGDDVRGKTADFLANGCP